MGRVVIALVLLGAVPMMAGGDASGRVTSAAPPVDKFDQIFSEYAAGHDDAIAAHVATARDYDQFRASLRTAIRHWASARQPIQAVFILDAAVVGLGRHWPLWLDVLKEGREFVMSRPDPPGVDAADDAREIAWHKAAVALLEGLRRPDLIEDVLEVTISSRDSPPPDPLDGRMVAAPPATGAGRLVDPWIEYTHGVLEEEWATSLSPSPGCLTEPPADTGAPLRYICPLESHGAAAIRHFDQAATYDSTRTEALARKAWLLIELHRPADALSTLDVLGDGLGDPAIHYWARLFRARALDALGRVDDARRGYLDALLLAPHAQSPTLALAALALGQGQDADAFRLAAELRTQTPPADDPWWRYQFADNRFFASRMRALREAARR